MSSCLTESGTSMPGCPEREVTAVVSVGGVVVDDAVVVVVCDPGVVVVVVVSGVVG